MKKITLTVVTALSCMLLHSQINLQWAQKIDRKVNYDVKSTSITVDSKGNVYTTGYFSGTVDFNPGAGVFNMTANILPNAQGSIMFCTDVFVTKFDANGNFLWAKQWGGTGGDVSYSIAVDATGNVYTTGICGGQVDFDPDPSKSFTLPSKGYYEMFISKLDTDGKFKWAKTINETSKGYSLAVDANSNVYATGWVYANGVADFDPGPGVATAKDGKIYILKLNSSGTFQWVKGIGGFQNNPSGLKECEIALDPTGNIYTTGRFKNTGDFDPGVGIKNLTSKGLNDVFISKLNSSGNFVWVKQLGGKGNDLGSSIAVLNERVYITGTFTGTGAFDPNSNNKNLTSAGGTDIFITKLDDNGGFKWARRMGSTGNDYAHSINVDHQNDVYTTGSFSGQVDFDPKAGDNNKFFLTSKGSSDIFISKLSGAQGEYMFAKQIGSTKYDQGSDMCLDAYKNLHLTGVFGGTTDFDVNAGVKNLTSTNDNSMFVAKYNQPAIIVAIPVPLLFPEINVKVNNTDIPSGNNYDFGSVPVSTNKDVVFTIQNTGIANLNLNSIEITGVDFIKTGVAPANILAKGTSGNLTIRMKATNTPGNKAGQLIIKNNDVDEANYVINLKGIVEDIIEKAVPDEEASKSSATKNSVAVDAAPKSVDALSSAYPNPTHAGWTISFNEDLGHSTYTLLNKQGSVVGNGKITARTFYLAAENLPAGMYLLRVNNTKIQGAIRLIKE